MCVVALCLIHIKVNIVQEFAQVDQNIALNYNYDGTKKVYRIWMNSGRETLKPIFEFKRSTRAHFKCDVLSQHVQLGPTFAQCMLLY